MSDRLSELVDAISKRPADLSPRLDLADWRQSQRQTKLADWMRLSLSLWAARAEIQCVYPTTSVWGCVGSLSQVTGPDPRVRWEPACPDYWIPPVRCIYADFYGRWLFSCPNASRPADRGPYDELCSMVWLEKLQKDGLLELIEYELGSAVTASWALDLPAQIRSLPIFLNSARAFESLNKTLSRQVLSWPTLIGLYFKTGTFAMGVAAELPQLLSSLQFLEIEATKQSAEVDEVFEAIPHFPDLRLFKVANDRRLTSANLQSIARSPSARAIGVFSRHLDAEGFFTLGSTPSLRWLGINSEKLKRSDLQAFRKTFPNVHLFLSDDMRLRLGPA